MNIENILLRQSAWRMFSEWLVKQFVLTDELQLKQIISCDLPKGLSSIWETPQLSLAMS